MHLTEIRIDFEAAALGQFADAYQWHQRAWDCFDKPDGSERDFLTRLDRIDDGWKLLVLSAEQPRRPRWCPDTPLNWRTRPIPDDFLQHEHYAFSLRANASKKVRNPPEARNSRRVALHKIPDLEEWISRKAELHGFGIQERPEIKTLPRERFVRRDGSGTHKLGTHGGADFQGRLTVIDRDRFLTAFQSGIGPARAFGYGLLVLAPISS